LVQNEAQLQKKIVQNTNENRSLPIETHNLNRDKILLFRNQINTAPKQLKTYPKYTQSLPKTPQLDETKIIKSFLEKLLQEARKK